LNWSRDDSLNVDEDVDLEVDVEDMVVTRMRSKGSLGDVLGQERRQRDMADLARWLEEDLDVQQKAREDPWKTAADTAGVVGSPTEMVFPTVGQGGERFGFDDDFTVFVSAPAEPTPSGSSAGQDEDAVFEESSFDESPSTGRLNTSSLYHSLGSMSDLGELQDEEDEDWLPTKDEIKGSAEKIFGSSQQPPPAAKSPPESSRDNADEDDLAAFDLSNVLSALQGMKEEIAGIDDEDQRRKAAAKVALGLVYGLQENT
jgi:hypothetical protein